MLASRSVKREAEKQLNDMIGKPMQGAFAAGGGSGFLQIPANRKNASPLSPDTVAVNAAGAGLNSQEAAFRTDMLEALRAIATNTTPKPGVNVLQLVSAGLGNS